MAFNGSVKPGTTLYDSTFDRMVLSKYRITCYIVWTIYNGYTISLKYKGKESENSSFGLIKIYNDIINKTCSTVNALKFSAKDKKVVILGFSRSRSTERFFSAATQALDGSETLCTLITLGRECLLLKI